MAHTGEVPSSTPVEQRHTGSQPAPKEKKLNGYRVMDSNMSNRFKQYKRDLYIV